jgi:O-antigen/teichoic acid export membrane protein
VNNYSRKQSIMHTLVYFSALIINIFLGWILAKINTNYLEVAAYGQYAFFITVILFGRSLFDFGVFEASSRLMTTRETSDQQRSLLGTGLMWAIAFALLSVLILDLVGMVIDSYFEVKVGWLCQKFSYGAGLYILIAFLNRNLRGSGSINVLAVLSITPRIIYVILLIFVISFAGFTLEATLMMLFWGIIITLTGICIYLKPSFKNIQSDSRQILEEVKSYGWHIYVSTVWAEVMIHADKFIISYYLNSQELAYYALAATLTLPLSHFSSALSTSLFNRFARVDMISPRVIRINLIFVVISVAVFILLRKPLIYYLFSAQYAPAIELLLPLSLAFGLAGLSKPYTMFLMANKRGRTVRNISVLIPVIRIIGSILSIPAYGISGVAWVAFIVYLLDLALFMFAYRRYVNLPFFKLF